MKILVFPGGVRQPLSLELGRGKCAGLTLGAMTLAGGLVYGGYWVGQAQQGQPASAPRVAEQPSVEQVESRVSRGELQALAERMGQVHADLARLEALGVRLTREAGLDLEEFGFDQDGMAGGMGGPYEPLSDELEPAALSDATDSLAEQVAGREARYRALAAQLDTKAFEEEATPRGWPIDHAWLSSHYGERSDPITGGTAFHSGMDFASVVGEEVIATAEGVVVFAGWKPGYGNAVEVAHGNGYRTLYAHNKENLAVVGQRVSRGDALAKVGNTGRSTGPHVHFEVHRDGEPINPHAYVNQEP